MPKAPAFKKSRRFTPSQVRENAISLIPSENGTVSGGKCERQSSCRTLVVNDELLGVDERPEQALGAGQRRFGLGEVLRAAAHLVRRGQPAERPQVSLANQGRLVECEAAGIGGDVALGLAGLFELRNPLLDPLHLLRGAILL